jgi:acetoin:2,6-dichlorophenolindophenol oxidoreductase subunit alpha
MTDAPTAERLYRTMSLIRQFEVAASRLLAAGELPGFLHLSIGQEAVAAGVCDLLDEDDYITTTHRGHGHCIAKGGDVREMMAELFGRVGGYCGGRSGSMHIADPTKGILGANAIVGAGIPIALGGAFASQTLGQGRVAVAFFGEGAVAQGVVHESFNIAGLWKLPIIFVVENNQYAEMTHVSVHLKAPSVTHYGVPHGIPAESVDGNDVLAVRAATERAIDRARGGEGPTLLEAKTYRWQGHFEGDAQRYRQKAEVAMWKDRDPLTRFADRIDDAAAIDSECASEVAAAVEWARSQPEPGPEALSEHVFRGAVS